jgi:hypothetical protein
MGTPKTPPFWVQVHSTLMLSKGMFMYIQWSARKPFPHIYPKHTHIHVIGAREREERTWEVGSLLEDLFTCYQVVMSYWHPYLHHHFTSLPLLVCIRANPPPKCHTSGGPFYLQMGLYKVFYHIYNSLVHAKSFSTILSIKMKYWPMFSWGDYYIKGFIGYHPQEDRSIVN